MRGRPDLTALLDVTQPEPTGENSPLRALRDVLVTSHIAGAIQDEVLRLADLCIACVSPSSTASPAANPSSTR